MNVLITGGAGYIGSHCNKFFREKGFNTIVLDDLSAGHREAVKYGKFIKGDFGDNKVITNIFKAEPIDAVIHLAAFADVADSMQNPSKYYGNNVSKMITLLDAMVQYGIRHIIFSSSAAIFGEPIYVPIDEAHSQHPINPYGETKCMGEKLLRDYARAYGIKYAALRYFSAAGADVEGEIGEAHCPEHHLIPLMLKTVLGKGQKLQIYGKDYDTPDGTCIRDFVHVTDLAEAHYLALQYILQQDTSEVFNLGSNAGFSLLEIIKTFEQLTNTKVPFECTARRPGDPAKLVAANIKARQLLHWQPKLTIRHILHSAWRWEQNRKY